MSSRRKIIVLNRLSLNGYFAGMFGSLQWMEPDEEYDALVDTLMSRVDTVLLGRRTYELLERLYRGAKDGFASAAHPERERRRFAALRSLVIGVQGLETIVFSSTLEHVQEENVRLVRRMASDEIAAAKRQEGKDILVLGSGSIVSQLAEGELVDEYYFVMDTAFLGDGRPLLAGVTKRFRMVLAQLYRFASGAVLLRYVRPSTF